MLNRLCRLPSRCVGSFGALRSMYKAAVVESYGNLELREMKSHSPREDEMVVEVESAGVNEADMRMINGTYHLKPPLPFVPGFELAGNVKAVGKKVTKWKENDRVVVIRSGGTGAFAEECVVNVNSDVVVGIPYAIDYDTAAGVSISYGTAFLALQKMAKEKEGSNVLVLSSRGMVAFAAIDLAHNVFKANVMAASDDEVKLNKLRETGVTRTINYEKEKMIDVVHANTMGHGVDVVVDTVGGKIFHQALQCLRPGGTLFSLGFASGDIPSLSLLDLHQTRTSVTGIWLGGYRSKEVEKVLEIVLDLFSQQFLQGRVEAKYRLKDTAKCVQDVNANKVFGKAIISPKDL